MGEKDVWVEEWTCQGDSAERVGVKWLSEDGPTSSMTMIVVRTQVKREDVREVALDEGCYRFIDGAK